MSQSMIAECVKLIVLYLAERRGGGRKTGELSWRSEPAGLQSRRSATVLPSLRLHNMHASVSTFNSMVSVEVEQADEIE